MLYQYIVLNILITTITRAQNIEENVGLNCTQVRDVFANASSDFIKCSVDYSRPITFCEECVTKYISVLTSYKNMSHVSNNGTPCLDSFINLDRLGIIKILYDNSVNLWTRAKCYECFIIDNNTQTTNISQQTKIFKEFYSNYSECVNNSNSNICETCMDKYVSLQNYFLSVSNENEKIGACMDIVDLMNNTWTFWGETCCRFRRHNEYTFIATAIVVLISTVLFYVVAQIYAKKKLPTIVEQSRFLNTLES